jgi:hypothetical protein
LKAQSKGTREGAINARVNVCQSARELVHWLEAAVNQIPSSMPYTAPDHPLNAFAIDPHVCVANLEPGKDNWMILNPMFKFSFRWGETEA